VARKGWQPRGSNQSMSDAANSPGHKLVPCESAGYQFALNSGFSVFAAQFLFSTARFSLVATATSASRRPISLRVSGWFGAWM
jgi:hypothetical protein